MLSTTSQDPIDVIEPGEVDSVRQVRTRKKRRCTLHPDCQWSYSGSKEYRRHAFVHHRLERSIAEARILTSLVSESMGIRNSRSTFLEKSLKTGMGRLNKPDLPRPRNIEKEKRILASWDWPI